MLDSIRWADFLNVNLMAHEQLAAISQLFKFTGTGARHDVLEACRPPNSETSTPSLLERQVSAH
jgi:hypothetical protein